MPGGIGGLHIWRATSPDLIHWGQHRLVLQSQPSDWTAERVGGGAPPVRTERGWLSIYHAANQQDRYCLGAFVTALDDPMTVIVNSQHPLLEPKAPCETDGFFSNVAFSCGVVRHDNTLWVYYGAADETIALATVEINGLLDKLFK